MQTPGHTFFHSSQWAKVLAQTYGYRPFYISQLCHEGFRVLLPLMEIRSVITGTRAVSLPFTDYCDPLIDPEADPDETFQFALELGRKSKWAYLEVRSTAFQNRQATESYFRHTLDLKPGKEEIFHGLRDSTRRNIRNAERQGVETWISRSYQAIKLFFELHCLTRRGHGLPPQPFRFFQKIHEHVISKDTGFVVLAASQGRIIAGAVFFHFGCNALFKFGASDARYQRLRPNNLVMWTAIQYYLAHEFSILCFGRTHPHNVGLRQFKNGWGPTEDTLYYYRYGLRPRLSRNARFLNGSIHSTTFERLPIPILRVTGALLYRHFG